MARSDTKLDLIADVPLFGGCRGRDLQEVGRLADEVDVPAGKVLMREGEPAREFVIVVEGTLRVERGGREIARLGPGQFAGEIGLIDGGPRTATVIAETPTRLLVLAHREFVSLLDRFPSIQLQVLQAMAHRVRSLDPEGIH